MKGLGQRRCALLAAAMVLASSLQVAAPSIAQARTPPHYDLARGLGPKPYQDGDCRLPNPDAPPDGEMCIEHSRLGDLTVSPKISQGCRKGEHCGSVTASFSPSDIGAYWTIDKFGDAECTEHYVPSPDTPGGRKGGNTCVLKNPGGTGGWTKVSATAYGACGSVAAAQNGHTEFAICLPAVSSDYYAVIPPGVSMIDGTVLQEDGKTPMVGVNVLIRSEKDNKRSVALTDSAGYYSAFLEPGIYSICPCLFKDDRFNSGPGDHFQPESARVHVDGYATRDFVQHGLDISGAVRLKIPRKNDPPMAGVRIGLFGRQGTYREAVTDKKGKYHITVPPEAYAVRALSPPPLAEGEHVGGADYACVLGGVEQSSDSCLIEGTNNKSSVDMVFDNTLKLTLTRGAQSLYPDRNVHQVRVKVTDQKGSPVSGVKVNVTASTRNGQVVLGTATGAHLWPPAPLDPDQPTEDLPPSGFSVTTQSDGQEVIEEWADDSTQAGSLELEAKIDHQADGDPVGGATIGEAVAASETSKLPPEPPPPPAVGGSSGPALAPDIGDILDRGVRGRLSAPLDGNAPQAHLQFAVMNAMYGLKDTGNGDFVPVKMADGTGAIVVYPKNVDAKGSHALASYLKGKKTPPPTSPAVLAAQVIDITDVARLARESSGNHVVPSKLPSLATWAANRTVTLGLLTESGPGFSYLGLPHPRPVATRTRADRVLGVSQVHYMRVRTRGKVRVLATRRAKLTAVSVDAAFLGGRVGWARGAGKPVIEVVGADVVDRGFRPAAAVRPVGPIAADPSLKEADTLLLPEGDYDLEVYGTGQGPAYLEVLPSEDGSNARGFALDAADNRSATLSISTGVKPASTLRFGPKTVVATDGPRLVLSGVPKRVASLGATPLQMKVVDEFGNPVEDAHVQVANRVNAFHAYTDSHGAATITLTPTGTDDLTAVALVEGYAIKGQVIKVGPAVVDRAPILRMLAGAHDVGTPLWLALFTNTGTWILLAALVLVFVLVATWVRRRRTLLAVLRL